MRRGFATVYWESAARILESGVELVADLAADSGGEPCAVPLDESPHGGRIRAAELAQRPGQSLDHHVVAILDEPLADRQRSRRIDAATFLRPIQRHSADQSSAPQPSV